LKKNTAKMPIIFIDPLSDPLYDQFVNSHPNASFFHSSTWARVLHDTYGFKPNCIALSENGQIRGLLPFMETKGIFRKRRAVSMPFSDFCEPLFDNQDDFQKVFDVLVQKGRESRWQFIQVRGGKRIMPGTVAHETIFTHDIDLTRSENDLIGSFRESTRRNIRKAEKSGISIIHETSQQAVKEFYRLNCLTRREHGLPPQPWHFFKNLHQLIFSSNKGFISLAVYKKQFISGNLYLICDKKALYKYGASDKRYQHLRPSNLTIWKGMEKCRNFGCQSLNLGRTEQHHKGLLQFKRGLGCEETEINYYRFDIMLKCFLDSSFHMQNKNWQYHFSRRLPLPILKFIGNMIYKYAG
jgi:lipid II:glycine glycyltransferase (peptidoglycan interpeptide bridge formation enzyme)